MEPIKIFRAGKVNNSPFLQDDPDQSLLLQRGVVYTDRPEDCDVVVAMTLEPLQPHIEKFRHGKKYLIWNNEPRGYIFFDKKKVCEGVLIHVLNAYTGDCWMDNYHVFKFKKLYDESFDPLGSQSGFSRPKGKKIVALLGYRPDKRIWGLKRDGADIDLSVMRTELAMRGHELGKADVYGSHWPKGIGLEDSRTASDWRGRKEVILQDYSFNLAMENTNIDYYCTEKIWDSILAGCLPIYWGKGNKIYEDFPKNSFLDYADFNRPEALFTYIDQMGFAEFKERFDRCAATCRAIAEKYPTRNELKELRALRVERILSQLTLMLEEKQPEAIAMDKAIPANGFTKMITAKIDGFMSWFIMPDPVKKELEKGQECLQKNALEEAEAIFLRILQKHPKKPWGYTGLAKIASRREQWELAQQWWEKLLSVFPKNENYLVNLGNVLYEQNKYAEGDAVFEKIRREFPKGQAPVPHFRGKREGFFAQNGQDRYVAEALFDWKRNGIFVDVGAHAGTNLSNTYYLEKELGWSGIAVEPNPPIFERLKKNRTCVTLQACITDFNGETDFLSIEGGGNMLSGIMDKYDQRHIERVNRVVKEHKGKKKQIKMPCLTLNNLLEKYAILKVDYLSIDTIGGELDILKAIDFERFDIEVIGVENNFRTLDFREFLSSKGYKLMAIGGADEIYQKQKQ